MNRDKVECISETGFHTEPYPKVGYLCVVLDARMKKGKLYYRLLGYDHRDSNGLIFGYVARNFRPIDDTFGEEACENVEKEFKRELIPV